MKEWILSEEEKKVKRSKIAENRKKRQCISKGSKRPDSTTSTISHNLIQLLNNGHQRLIRDSVEYNGLLSRANTESEITLNIKSKETNNINVKPKREIIASEYENELSPSGGQNASTNGVMGNSSLKNLLANDYNDSSQSLPSSPVASMGNSSNTGPVLSPLDNSQNTDFHFNCLSKGQKEIPSTSQINTTVRNKDLLVAQSFLNSETNHVCNKVNKVDIPEIVYQKLVDVEFSQIAIRQTVNEANCPSRRELNAIEQNKLEELLIANSIFKMPLPSIVPSDPSDFLDVIKMTDYAIRRLIKMSKKLPAFMNLCQQDQIALLKGGCTEIMVLRSVMAFNQEKECWSVSIFKFI